MFAGPRNWQPWPCGPGSYLGVTEDRPVPIIVNHRWRQDGLGSLPLWVTVNPPGSKSVTLVFRTIVNGSENATVTFGPGWVRKGLTFQLGTFTAFSETWSGGPGENWLRIDPPQDGAVRRELFVQPP